MDSGKVLSTGEALGLGVSTTIVGMCTVFAVLSLLGFIVYLIQFISGEKKNKPGKPAHGPGATTAAPQAAPEGQALQFSPAQEEPAVVAAIMSAIAALMNTSTDRLIVRSIRRHTTWIGAARREAQGRRLS